MSPNTPQPFSAVSAVPRGLGIYVMDISKKVLGTPEEAAQKAVDHGLSWVALAACWQDGPGLHRPMNQADLDDYGPAFRARGVLPWVFGYPWGTPEQVIAFVPRMRHAADEASAVGVIVNPELGFRGKPALLRDLMTRTVDSLDETLGLGFTTYGQPPPDFPLDVAGEGPYGWGSPQCYQMQLAQAREALKKWSAHGWHDLVVGLPTYGKNTQNAAGAPDMAKLIAYCAALLELTGGAGCFWQWLGTTPAEWEVIRLLSQMEDFVSAAASHAGDHVS